MVSSADGRIYMSTTDRHVIFLKRKPCGKRARKFKHRAQSDPAEVYERSLKIQMSSISEHVEKRRREKRRTQCFTNDADQAYEYRERGTKRLVAHFHHLHIFYPTWFSHRIPAVRRSYSTILCGTQPQGIT